VKENEIVFKNHILADEKISRLLIKLSLPATIGMLVMALYNIVDTIFVGHGVGPMAIGGLSVVFPVQIFIMAFGQFLGMGGASLVSRSIGQGKLEVANTAYGNIIILNLLFGLAITIFGLIFMESLLTLFGSTGDVYQYASDYMRIILFSAPVLIYMMASNNILRAEGKAKIAMGSMLVSALTNIVLDAIFIFYFHWGVKGAAWATVIAKITTSVYIILYIQSNRSTLHFRFKYLKPNLPILKEIFAIGISAFFRQIATSILVIVANNVLTKYGNSLYLAAYGVINRLMMFCIMPIFGIAQGLQPVVGFNYGAKRLRNVLKAYQLASLYSTVISVLGFFLILIFPAQLMSIFTKDAELIKIGVHAMKLMVIAMPVIGFQINGAMFFQALGKAIPAFILTTSRQILFLIPLLILLPQWLSIKGIWLSFPIADVLAAVLTLFFLLPQMKKLKV
jgi:putative MATE family efflux protein